jgi:hypothetical protein
LNDTLVNVSFVLVGPAMALEAGLGVPLVPSVSMSLQLGSNKWTFNQKIRANGLGGNHSAALMESTDES